MSIVNNTNQSQKTKTYLYECLVWNQEKMQCMQYLNKNPVLEEFWRWERIKLGIYRHFVQHI